MGFKKENYTPKGLCACIFLWMMITCNHAFAQTAPHCPVRVDFEPRSEQISSAAKDSRQNLFPFFASWQDLENLRLSDEKHAVASLDGYQRSTMVFGDNMSFNIPEGAEVSGIELFIEGHTRGEGLAEGLTIQLLNDQGEIAGENKAHSALPSDRDWLTTSDSTDFIWRYGSENDNWGLDLNQFIGNNPNIGYALQVRNKLELPIDILIDNIQVVVHYTPLYTICIDHACVPVYIDESDDPQVTYEWYIPQGWEMISDSEHDAAINIEPSYAELGIYEICVESFFAGDSQGLCCREFSFGDCNPGMISGEIFLDQNGNFSDDATDLGQENILVNLYHSNGIYSSTTNTDVDGQYIFPKVFQGDYYIEVELQDGLIFVLPNIGNKQDDSDITNEFGIGTTDIISVSPGQEIIDIDGGLSRSLSIGNFVWDDLNADGVQQDSEPGIAGITVNLSNNLIGEITKTTNENGYYQFLDIPSSDYIISFDTPSLFVSTIFNNGNADNDNDYNGTPLQLSYLNGGNIDSIDAGFFRFGSIGNFVWDDLNENGIQDSNEPGMQDVTINLKDDMGMLISTMTTDVAGFYQFTNLVPGVYTLDVFAEEFLTLSMIDAGPDPALDSDGIKIDNIVTTNPITIVSGDQNTDIDFGYFFEPVTISGFTWIDEDNDGQYQTGETLLPNILVSLFDANGQLVADTLSDTEGSFIFEDKEAGTYYLSYELPAGSIFTDANIGDNNSDSDVDGSNGTGTTAEITLLPGEMSIDNAAGYILLPSVEGLTWEDVDANGTREINEPIISGIVVNLRSTNGDLIATQATDALGVYKFENLPITDYYIEFVKNESTEFTTHIANIALNSDVDGIISSGTTSIFTLLGNQDLQDIDAGFYTFGSIGDFVWEDLNENGIQDLNEPGIQGVSISLKDDMGMLLTSMTTDVNGMYQFTNLIPGVYTLDVVAEDFLTLSMNSAGSDTALDSDGIIIDNIVTTNPITIESGNQNTDIDFGYIFFPVTISGFTWIDENNDGQYQMTEALQSSILVSLLDEDGLLVDDILSDVNGVYSFEGQKSGTYYLQYELPDGSIFTEANIGDNKSDSDVDGTNGAGTTAEFTLLPGEMSIDNAAGYILLPTVEGLTWEDLDANGIRENNEPIISGIVVNLRNPMGDLVETQTTNNQGIYKFDNLPIGDYYIEFMNNGTLEVTTHIANMPLNSDVDDIISSGATSIFTLAGNQNLSDIDAGFFTFGSIGNFVWEDLNENGIQDVNEPGIQGVIISLKNNMGMLLSTMITDLDGMYHFTNLMPGLYTLDVVADDLLTLTMNAATNVALDSDGIIIDNIVTTNPITIISNTQNTDIDFGFFFLPVTISGFTWIDENNDGQYQIEEVLQSSILVSLFDADGILVDDMLSDVNGAYSFEDQIAGTYYLEYELPVGSIFTGSNIGNNNSDSDVDGSNGIGTTTEFTLLPGDMSIDNAAGYILLPSVEGLTWEDVDGNGMRGNNEPIISNIVVNLRETNGNLIATETTNTQGIYKFDNIAIGEYYIEFVKNGSLQLTTHIANMNLNSDVDGVISTGATALFTLSGNQNLSDIDAGFFTFGSIGDFVWDDLNENGSQDINEPGIQGVTITLKDNMGMVLESKDTDADGMYKFTNLVPGVYTLDVVAEDFLTLTMNAATNAALDSDGIIIDNIVTTNPITIVSNTQNTDIDFGFFFQPVTISGFTWIDENNSGQYQNGEPLLSSILVSLLDDAGLLVDDMLTDADGAYAFEDQITGTYHLKFELPAGSIFTDANIGANNSDSDVDGSNGAGTTAEFTLLPGEMSVDNDAGYILLPSVEGLTWEDLNGNGVRGSNEPIITDIVVNLRNTNNDIIRTATTNTQGIYKFESLPIGDYYIEFVKTEALQYTTHISNMSLNSDVDGVISNGATSIFTLSGNQNLSNIDAGFYTFGSIGDFVWEDLNENGIQDVNEPGIQGVTISLKDNMGMLLGFVVTDADGMYQFTNLMPGVYTLDVAAEDFLTLTIDVATNAALDSDGIMVGNIVTTNPITILSNTQNTDIDFGFFFQPVTISGFTWLDENNSGQYQNGEPLLSSILVSLFNADDLLVDDMLTDENGAYSFEGQIAGTYYLEYELPVNSMFTEANVGANNSDSDVDGSNGAGTTAEFTLLPGGMSINNAAGYILLPSVEGLTWEDLDGNGIRGNNEPVITDIVVNLRNSIGDLIETQTTNNQGIYKFDNISIGEYYIEFVKTEALQFTTHIANMSLNSDVDGMISPGATSIFTLSGNQNLSKIDAGFFTFGSIGDFVWEDLNENGIQDLNEPGIQGVTITLKDEMGTPKGSAVTDADGMYQFTNLAPGAYTLDVVVDDQLSLTINTGTDVSLNSDGILIGNMVSTNPITIVSGNQNNDIDFGFYVRSATISGFTWIDGNNDGQFQMGELLLANILVSLFDTSDILVADTPTDINGLYSFEDITAGTYYLQYELPNGSIFTDANIGNNNSDSDVDGTNGAGTTEEFTLLPNEMSLNNAAGYILLPSVEGLTWEDLDGNGIRENNEPIVSDIVVNLRVNGGVLIETTTTNAQGIYKFENLPIGDYYIEFVKNGTLEYTSHIANMALNSDVDGIISIGATSNFTLAGNQNLSDIDAGFYAYGSIGDFVWEDSNKNGIQDLGEPGIQGIKLYIIDDMNMVLDSTITDMTGLYEFTNLVPGEYTLEVQAGDNLSLTINSGTDTTIDSDGIIMDNAIITNPITIASGTQNADIDFGFFLRSVIISGFTWIDENNDGQYQIGEALLSDILVSLFDTDDALVADTLSDIDGFYSFENINAGTYYLHFELPNGSVFTIANMGDDILDSDVDGTNGAGTTGNISLLPNELSIGNAAGYILLPSVEGLTWEDLDGNGIRDNNEPIITDIVVNLRDFTNQTLVETTTTNAQGTYKFENLPIGDYYIEFVKTAALEFTTHITNMALNSDVDEMIGLGTTASFTLSANQSLLDIDAGFYTYGSIGDFVWEDLNKNGLQELGEPGIQGVKLYIIDDMNMILDSVTTDETGYYIFTELFPGNYTIELTPESFYTLTMSNQGDEELDSDGILVNGVATSLATLISSGDEFLNIDFGFVEKPSIIGGFTWLDTDNDGQFQIEETSIANVTVSIYKSDDTFLDQTTSNAAGFYSFANIESDDLYLVFEMLDGHVFTSANQGDDLTDSDVTSEIVSGSTAIISLLADEENLTNSAGYQVLPKVGDYVWLDSNGNGLQDDMESGLNGISIYLHSTDGTILDSTITGTSTGGTNGYYLFDSLAISDYYISFATVDTLNFTSSVGTDLTLNSDITGENGDGTTSIFSLVGNQCNLDIDGGYSTINTSSNSISGEVWIDSDLDGIQNVNDKLVAGIGVKLYTASNIEIGSTISDIVGQYSFNALDAGSYYIVFDTTERYMSTLPLQPTDPALDSDIDNSQVPGSTNLITITAGTNAENIDAGLIDGAGTIDGFTWIDDNNNGTRDLNELDLNNIEVKLFLADGTFINSVLVDSEGNYEFTDILSGDYFLVFENQDETFFNVEANQGPDDLDDDITDNISIGSTDTITVTYFNALPPISGGYYQLAALGDMVFIDENENGTNDGEQGINGITVHLLNLDGEIIQSTMTAQGGKQAAGYYFMENIVPGAYQVQFIRPLLYKFIDADIGMDDTIDSDVITTLANTGTTDTIFVTSNSMNPTVDAGLVELPLTGASISGIVWDDENVNGTYQVGETLRPFVTIALLNEMNVILDTEITNANGEYTFGLLPQGFYTLRASMIGNETATIPNIGMDDTVDSDFVIVGAEIETEQFFLNDSDDMVDIDLGIVNKIKVGNFIWEDSNNDGIQGNTEAGIINMPVTITDESNTISKVAITDENGNYQFADLPAGNYKVCVTIPEGYLIGKKNIGTEQLDSDANPDGCTDFMLFLSGTNNDIDISMTIAASISGVAFTDLNGNGTKNNFDPGIDDIPVFLYSAGLKIDSTITQTKGDTTGFYSFTNLQVGDYYVVFDIPEGYLISEANVSLDDVDSDITNAFGIGSTDLISLESGQELENFDAGIYLPACIGDRIWEDLDKNGIQDAGELGVAGLDVVIFRSFGVPFDTVTSNSAGDYKFSNLKQGLYFIQFVIPQEYTITTIDEGDEDDIDSDADETGKTPLISLAHGADLTSIDCGIFLSEASLRSVVWEDINGDGIRQSTEARIPDIRISLIDNVGGVVASTTSNALGLYAFQEIPVGNYNIFVDLATTTYDFTTIDAAGNDLIDSDINPNGESDIFSSGVVLSVPNVDVGLFETGSIGGFAWFDENQNGMYDLDEANLPNVTVSLYNERNEMVSEMITSTEGDENISFTNLRPGQYQMVYKFNDDLEASLETGEIEVDNNSDILLTGGIYSSPYFTVESSNIVTHIDAGFFIKTNPPETEESSNVNQAENELILSIHPNPATNYIRVEIANKENATVKVLNTDKKVVLTASGKQMEQIDLQHLHPGIYYVTLEQDGKTVTKKLIKVH